MLPYLSKLQGCNRCQKTRHYTYKYSSTNTLPRKIVKFNCKAANKGPSRGSYAVAKTQQRGGQSKKWLGSVGAEHPTDPSTSSDFVALLTRIAPNTQSLCVTSSGNEVYLTTLEFEVAKDISLRAMSIVVR